MLRRLIRCLSVRATHLTHDRLRSRRQKSACSLLVESLEPRALMSATPTTAYLQTNLISDQAGVAAVTDPSLVNAWGLALPPTGGNFWIADNGTNLSSVYGGNVNHSALTKNLPDITIPADGPTGVVFNGTSDFVISDSSGHSGPAAFIFVTESGAIVGWNPTVNSPPTPSTMAQVATTVTDAIYKGVTLGNNGTENLLYAANFHSGHIDVFDTHFAAKTLTGSFTDPNLPAGYAPFNIANIGGTLYVTYAQQDADAHDEVAGPGKGFVDKFDMNGNLLGRFASRGALNAPWGTTQAPANFGQFSGDILVGNFGDGRIDAYRPDGHFAGALRDEQGKPVVIDGLWALEFGNGVTAGDANALYFTAGPDDESHGLFGKLAPATNLTEKIVISGPALKRFNANHSHLMAELLLHNHTKSTINGPVTIIFDRLPAGVTLNNATGLTAAGHPFITVSAQSFTKHKTLRVPIDVTFTGHNLGRVINALHDASVVQGQFG
jgi:uncharacterized protein (TIGR03118 family)